MNIQKLELRIDWKDQDLLGHVNNLAVIGYFQSARIAICESIGFAPVVGMHYGPIEAATEVQFRKQLHYPGNITVLTGVEKIGNTSFILNHRIVDSSGEVAAYGKEVIVCFDFHKQCKIPVPESVRQQLYKYLLSEDCKN
ncbi:MAG: acyl-CoA thioesterase [Lentisphaeria bacterium]|nr:acyl-CoA thioesterase [Lentisphaeria bacterium]